MTLQIAANDHETPWSLQRPRGSVCTLPNTMVTVFSLAGLMLALWWAAIWENRAHGFGHASHDGVGPIVIDHDTRDGRVKGVAVGIDHVAGFDFLIRPESWFDRLSVMLGLTWEFQSGDAQFDRRFFIASDDLLLGRALSQSRRLRDALLSVWDAAVAAGLKPERIACRRGRLWIACRVRDAASMDALLASSAALQSITQPLRQIRDQLTRLRPDRFPLVRDRYATRFRSISAASVVCLLFALGQLIRLAFVDVPFTLDLAQLRRDGLIGGLVATALLVGLTVALLGRTSRVHHALSDVIVYGAFGLIVSTTILMRDINIEFDRSPATRHVQPVVSAERRIGIKRDHYYITVQDPSGAGTFDLRVDGEPYRRSPTRVIVQERAGRLGYRWIQSVTLVQ